jgi:hypothetical protein
MFERIEGNLNRSRLCRTVESRHKMGLVVVNNILAALKGKPLINLVSDELSGGM